MGNRVPITAKYELPGYQAYNGAYPREITLRAMTTLEEKIRLQSDAVDVIPRLIDSCIVDEGINAFDLKVPDVQRLMYGLRSVTYGPEYNVDVKCPYCKSINSIEVDLDSLLIDSLPEDFHEPFEIGPLPVSGDVLTCRLLSMREYIDIDSESKTLARQRKRKPEDVAFNLEYQHRITAVNGQPFFPAQMDEYINTLNMKDLRYFDCRYDEVLNSFGIDTNIACKCDSCRKDFDISLPVTTEFFRPEL